MLKNKTAVFTPGFFEDHVDKARRLVASSYRRKDFSISLDTRQSLAALFNTEECLNKFAAIIEFNRPLKDEVAPWEDDPQLQNMLDLMEEEAQNDRVKQEEYLEECRRNLQLAENDFDDFICGARFSSSSDELQVLGRTALKRNSQSNHNPVKRKSSLLSETFSSQIEMNLTCTNCHEHTGAIIHTDDLVAIVDSSNSSRGGNRFPVTSTPHLRKYRTRASSVGSARRSSFQDVEENSDKPKLKRSSTVHFEDEIRPSKNVMERSVEAGATGCLDNSKVLKHRSSTFVADPKDGGDAAEKKSTFLKRSDTTIIKRAKETTAVVPKKTGAASKAVQPRSRFGQTLETSNQPTVVLKSKKIDTKTILPAKYSTNPPERPSRLTARKLGNQREVISSSISKTTRMTKGSAKSSVVGRKMLSG